MPEYVRTAYSSGLVPGEPIADFLAYTKTPDESALVVLLFEVQTIEVRHLGPNHRRSAFIRADNWIGQWPVP